MKNHLFCVGIEFKKASDPSESYAYVTAYLGAKNIDEAMICAELAGDFHLGYARQLTDKSSLLFDLAF